MRRSSWHVLLITLGLLLAQGSMLLHLLLVPHAACEHGELVEIASVALSDGAPAPSGPALGDAANPQVEREHAGSSAHDHCDALALRHAVPEVGAPVAAASLVWIAPIEARGERRETRPVPLLSLAPKGSPPV